MSVPDFLAAFNKAAFEEPVVIMGRVRRIRSSGKDLLFMDVVNEFEKVQVMISRKKCFYQTDSAAKWRLFRKLVKSGDHISVTGTGTTDRNGKATIHATQLPELVSPALEQIPEKIIDSKTKALDRHIDLLVNKESVDILRLRSEILKHMRGHFESKRFLEFQTPILARNAGGAVARPFVTQATGFEGKDMALRVAPELWLKRLVVGGVEKVFEIGPSFRNEGIDATHNPEFTSCEFYSAYSNLSDLIRETEELLHGLAQRSHELISNQLSSLPQVDVEKFAGPYKQLEFVPALEKAIGVRLPKLSSPDALPELLAVLKLQGIHLPGETPTSMPKLLDRLAALYIEPESFTQPLFITNHPVCMSPLAKSFVCPKTLQLVSARAELFVGGRELANMYEEENNPKEQERKLAAHRAMDRAVDNDGEAAPLDQSFVRALDYGLPPTGGWGCGIERLVMLFSGSERISDCLSFGTLRNVVGVSDTAGEH
ncbi:hypothetical protein B0I35DRAFT_351255 [Stachybotrys elegans]|uniref:Aminoacyl-transfer RNA synthetases class-II family profile domain-containing protein n=1 Tax=Stachybotrys elegans TaxID=80388 RepID=A0A8K0SUJ9_9HYPO|nr:hypothetical protein B0I35DRAFT_351255 [Stachybotrys elegans]